MAGPGDIGHLEARGDFPLKKKNVASFETEILSFNTTKLDANFAVLATESL